MKRFLTIALVGVVALGLTSTAFANFCSYDAVPAATLLFPFVQLDYENPTSGDATLFAITNVSAEAQIVHITVWTDYSVAIFYEAVKAKKYTCFVREDTRLPLMYMPDCLKATIDLMEADFDTLKHHSDFNVTAMSFSAAELADEIKKYIPEFECTFEPDFRQEIADSWPNSIDDTAAREEWGWEPEYDLAAMSKDMLDVLSKRHAEGNLGY